MSSETARMPLRQRNADDADFIKSQGAVYTPPMLARFVARTLLRECSLPVNGSIEILDPAMGDGALLLALLENLDAGDLTRCAVRGYDTDPDAIAIGQQRLQGHFPEVKFEFAEADFLSSPENRKYDLIIANPPYVRTQVMGAKQSQDLAEKYGLTGRVDLYYPFMLAIAEALALTGAAAIITSNRFLTTKSGQVVREALLDRFRLQHIYDLGDTKLFDAAVLPAITIANGMEGKAEPPRFSSIYETKDEASQKATSVIEALHAPDGTVVSAGSANFKVRHGLLEHGHSGTEVWRIGSQSGDEWLSTVKAHTWDTFSSIGKIRVGVKSTADKVFIRSDWGPADEEPELLLPLLTRHFAQQYRASPPKNPKHRKRILYPHYSTESGKRAAVDLKKFPRAEAYLESHREQLEGREYLISGGRNWFEIWVPQDPGAWKHPKLVFPDISEKPCFWMDLDGAVVNGECYFLRSENGSDPDLLWLALAVANSRFIEAFYDHCFNNKLYAGRRRWITQYVEKFPLPDPRTPIAVKIIDSAKRLYELTPSIEAAKLAEVVDNLVLEAFGLFPE